MFPLGTVLFPHMPLPLRVFEPRYLIMLGRLLESETPEFGVVLIERGHEVGGGEERSGVATMARVVEADAREDSSDSGEPTVCGSVDWLLTTRSSASADRGHGRPRSRLSSTCAETEASARGPRRRRPGTGFADDPQVTSTWPADTEVADDPLVSAWQLAAITPMGPLDAQSLLGSATTEELLVRTRDLARDATQTALLLGVLRRQSSDRPVSEVRVGGRPCFDTRCALFTAARFGGRRRPYVSGGRGRLVCGGPPERCIEARPGRPVLGWVSVGAWVPVGGRPWLRYALRATHPGRAAALCLQG